MKFSLKSSSTFLLFLLALFSCNKNSLPPENNFSVSGYVYYIDNPIADVTVSIDDKHIYTIQTDVNGFFKINDVDKGNHQLKIYKNFPQNGEAFSERTYDIEVNDEVTFDNLILPESVYLYEPLIIRIDSIQVAWSPSDIEDFKEYKIYRHTSSGLDETTGVLIHVSTSINDTTYLDAGIIHPGDYFYRVYIMNNYGRLGGSNIESYNLPPSIFSITINYTGNFTINTINKVYVGVSVFPDELQDDGIFTENNAFLEMIIDDTNSFHFYLQTYTDDYNYGPYYIGAFLDITGSHQGSSTIPSGCPAIFYEDVNPFDSLAIQTAAPVIVTRGEKTEITINFDDSYLAP